MAQFVNDTFTDTNGTTISSHTGETGATWTALTGSGHTPTIQSNALDPGTGASANGLWYASGTPAAADYTVTAEVTYNGGTDAIAGPGARMSTSAQTGYWGFLFNGSSGSFDKFATYKYVAGTLTRIAGTGSTPSISSGIVYTCTLDVSGSTIALRVQRSSDSNWLNSSGSWQSGQTNCLSTTDTSISAAGRPGFWLSRVSASQSTIARLYADEAGGGATTAPINTLVPHQAQAFSSSTFRGV